MQAALQQVYPKGIFKTLQNSSFVFVTFVSLAAFTIYTCMYGFRKPYTVGTYNNVFFLGISYKVCLVIAQVLGYMCSKFYGIKFISSLNPNKRAWYIVVFIGIAWISLLLFAIVPSPYNLFCMFLNGLPLGMIFGLVFGFLEGRITTEIMGAFLATSFIFASGLAKTTGKFVSVNLNIQEFWMPFVAAGFFVIPLLIGVWIIKQTPPPSKEDIEQRTIRKPMNKADRKSFLQQFGVAIVPVVISYSIFTIVRDFCEDFANELWIETGYQNNVGIFAQTSTIMSLIVIVVIGCFFKIQNNLIAFKYAHYLIIAGISIAVISTILFNSHFISPFIWMVSATTGLYLSYLPFNCLYFERFLSVYKVKGNMGFVMYIADAFGYLGTVLVLLIKEFVQIKYSWISFFSLLFYVAGIIGIFLLFITLNIHKRLIKKLNIS